MGNHVVKPAPDPTKTDAAANAELAQKAMGETAENFFKDVRLGNATTDGLGYKLAGEKLTDQEFKVICHTGENLTSDDINQAVDSLFSKDWKSLVKVALDEIVMFINAAPANKASIDEWSKAYLVWEDSSLLQYSVKIMKTSASSMGMVAANTYLTKLACVCRGVVAYEDVDPQIVVYELRKNNPDMSGEEFATLMKTVAEELNLAAKLTLEMRTLLQPIPTDGGGGAPGGGPAPPQPPAPVHPAFIISH